MYLLEFFQPLYTVARFDSSLARSTAHPDVQPHAIARTRLKLEKVNRTGVGTKVHQRCILMLSGCLRPVTLLAIANAMPTSSARPIADLDWIEERLDVPQPNGRAASFIKRVMKLLG